MKHYICICMYMYICIHIHSIYYIYIYIVFLNQLLNICWCYCTGKKAVFQQFISGSPVQASINNIIYSDLCLSDQFFVSQRRNQKNINTIAYMINSNKNNCLVYNMYIIRLANKLSRRYLEYNFS